MKPMGRLGASLGDVAGATTGATTGSARYRVACAFGAAGLLLALAGPATAQVPSAAAAASAPQSTGAPDAGQRFDFNRTPGRLPKHIVPTRVALALEVDPARPQFAGQATMQLDVKQASPEIVLHAHELTGQRARLQPAGGGAWRELAIRADAPAQLWRLVPRDGRPIAAGAWRLDIAYEGKVSRSPEGLYAVPHQVAGKPAQMLATQLEAIEARKVFPAFDEPAFRVAYQLSVRAPAGDEVLANMPLARQRSGPNGTRWHEFEATPPMPSYLVALAVGRFDRVSGKAGNVPISIVTAPGRASQGAYALGATQQLLPYYERYFEQPYALPKLDQLAVPAVRFGAMEDWGLISYNERYLLFDPQRSSPTAQRAIFSFMAHEIAHQWFGNLVTAASWNEIWLNEAFATWMASKATAHFNPQWNTRLSARSDFDSAMTRDAGPTTRPIQAADVPENRVGDMFDDLTYEKGGAVLGMVEQWVGEEPFRRGLAAYMRERRLSNATAADLWHHIGTAAGQDVQGVAARWITQPGFPLVRVASRCDQGQTEVTLSQRRYSSLEAQSPDAMVWPIPLTLSRDGQPHKLLFDTAQRTLRLPGCSSAPVIANADGLAFVRVAYAPDDMAGLQAGFAALPPATQVVLLSDATAMLMAGQARLADWLDLADAAARVRGPAQPALTKLIRVATFDFELILAGTPALPAMQARVRAMARPAFDELGWAPREGEPAESMSLRSSLMLLLALTEDKAFIDGARQRFDAAQVPGAQALEPSTRDAIYHAVGRTADAAHTERLKVLLQRADSESERTALIGALGSLRGSPERSRALMAWALSAKLPGNAGLMLPWMVSVQGGQPEEAYAFSLAHHAALTAFGSGILMGGDLVLPNAAEGFSDATAAQRLLADQQRLVGERGAQQAAVIAAAIEARARVRQRVLQALEEGDVLSGPQPR